MNENYLFVACLLLSSFGLVKMITELDFNPIKYCLPFPPAFVPNNKLVSATKILVGQLNGPESLLVEDGGNIIYTGTVDGKLLKIVNQQIVQSIHVNSKINDNDTCGTYETQPICGRPFAIRRLSPKYLIVIDGYRGLFKCTFQNGGSCENILPDNYKLNGGNKRKEECTFFNSFDIVKSGSLIMLSCASVRWDVRHLAHDFFEGRPNGRLIQFDLASGKAKIVLSNLNFANGVQAHPDGQSVLVSELTRARIARYYYDGPKKGSDELFAENLPGLPDNIQVSVSKKSFFVGMFHARNSELLTTIEKLGPYPRIRKDTVLLIPGANLRPYFFNNLIKQYGIVLELDLHGKIINTWQDPSGSVIPAVSGGYDNGTHLFLGSSLVNYISVIPLQ